MNPYTPLPAGDDGLTSDESGDDMIGGDWCVPTVEKCNECQCGWKCNTKKPVNEMCFSNGNFIKCKKFPCVNPVAPPPGLPGGGSGSTGIKSTPPAKSPSPKPRSPSPRPRSPSPAPRRP